MYYDRNNEFYFIGAGEYTCKYMQVIYNWKFNEDGHYIEEAGIESGVLMVLGVL